MSDYKVSIRIDKQRRAGAKRVGHGRNDKQLTLR